MIFFYQYGLVKNTFGLVVKTPVNGILNTGTMTPI